LFSKEAGEEAGLKLEVGEQKKQGNPMVEIALLKVKCFIVD